MKDVAVRAGPNRLSVLLNNTATERSLDADANEDEDEDEDEDVMSAIFFRKFVVCYNSVL